MASLRAATTTLLLLLLPCVACATDRPIIGVLALPIESGDCITFRSAVPLAAPPTSCFHSLYVKWLEAAGARVVPLPFDLPRERLDTLLDSINGALITGGETDIKNLHTPYMQAAGLLYNTSVNRHRHGEVWPLWGTCMGMQVLSVLGAADSSVLLSNAFKSEDLVLPLTLTKHAATSRLLCDGCLRPSEALTTLTTRNSTVNLHHDGVDPASFAPSTRLGKAFHVLSTNVDAVGKPFASTIEAATGAPIWGVQWHPERPQFEWKDAASGADRAWHAEATLEAMFAVAARLVKEARKSERRFATLQAEAAALIYNFRPVGDSSYEAFMF